MVLEYYWLLRSVLRAKPHLRRCLCRCRHCRIFFITDPRNAGRQDLGCPFGCKEAHRKHQSTRRSVEYYRDPLGKIKKRIQNNKRQRIERQDFSAKEELDEEVAPQVRWNEPIIEHVRMVSSLIEGRRVSRDEILEMLSEFLRQHSMVSRSKINHIVWQLNQNPP